MPILLAQTTGVDWIALLQTFGLAVAILFFIAMAGWRLAKWLGTEIIIPLRDRTLARFEVFLVNIEGTVGKVDSNVDTVTKNLEEQTATLKGLKHVAEMQSETVLQNAHSDKRNGEKLEALAVVQQEVRGDVKELQKLMARQFALLDKIVKKIAPNNGTDLQDA